MTSPPDLRQYPFHSVAFSSPLAGPRILITGAVHGNETCGTAAIGRVIEEINRQQLQVVSGGVTFVPVTNPLAYRQGRREGERNLNRRLRPAAQALAFEDHVANWLCPLMAQHQILLDLHSFRGVGQPFVMVGPEDNAGAVEPFCFAAEEKNMALHLGVHRFVDGWLSTYARGVERRRASAHGDADAQYGMGTTEYMRSIGGYALTLECGQHLDPEAPIVGYRAILNTLRLLGVLAGDPPAAVQPRQALRIYDVVDKNHADDRFVRAWASFDALSSGDVIGVRHDGTEVTASHDGCIIFPDAAANAGAEWFYLTKTNARFDT